LNKERLAAFSDGVIAIIITIMVLELKVPHGADFPALAALLPVFLSYVLSFVFVGIYWNNHHHLLHATRRIDSAVMWANMHLLFWLSLIPFATGWMGENHFAALPVAIYGVAQLMPALAYYILQACIVRANGTDKVLADALGRDIKGKVSPLFCLAGIGLAFVNPMLACAAYVLLALMWLIPDRRIAKTVGNS
jgi:TMEM175 potassium channel family protein